MVKKILAGILGGLLGCAVGAIVGGFFGLVVGGTFLGGLEFPNYPGLQGYELAAYIGVVIGLLLGTFGGIKIALRVAGRA